MKKSFPIASAIVICLLVGWGSRLFHATAMEVWYPTLIKSPLTPPDIVFPIMWGILYVLMGVSIGLVYNGLNAIPKKPILWLFAVQLALNVTWNLFFFYMQNPMLGLVNLLILDFLAAICFAITLQKFRSAAFCFLPYSLWIFFATYLNLYIFLYN